MPVPGYDRVRVLADPVHSQVDPVHSQLGQPHRLGHCRADPVVLDLAAAGQVAGPTHQDKPTLGVCDHD